MAIRQKLADDNPTVTKLQSDLARSRHNLGYLLSESGKLPEAEAEYRKSMAIYQKLADEDPSVTGFRAELANNHLDLGILLSRDGPARGVGGRRAQGHRALPEAERRQPERPWPQGWPLRRSLLPWRRDPRPRPAGRGTRRLRTGHRHPREAGQGKPESVVPQPSGPLFARRGLALRELGDSAGGGGRYPAGTRPLRRPRRRDRARSGSETACCRAALAGLAGARRSGRVGTGSQGRDCPGDGSLAESRRQRLPQPRRVPVRAGDSSRFRSREDFKKLLAELDETSAAKPKSSP